MQPLATIAPTEASEAGCCGCTGPSCRIQPPGHAYWWAMVLIGLAILAHTLRTSLAALPVAGLVQVVVGAAIAMLAGFFPVHIPRSKNSFASGEGLIGSWRTSKRWTSRVASPAMACVAMFATGSLLQAGIGAGLGQ
jgi:hypothetical protein